MRQSVTLGFAVAREDRARVDHLSEVFAGGNRSELLRQALDVMERIELAQNLGRSRSYGQHELETHGYTLNDVPMLVERALADPDPNVVAQAKLIVASLDRRRRISRPQDNGPLSDSDRLLATIFAEAAADTGEAAHKA